VPDEPYRPGVREDFDRLYRMSYHRILYTLTGILRDRTAAEDCTQEAFVRAFQAWPRWQPSAPAEAWLHRIAINVSSSYRRQQRLQEIGAVISRIGRPAPSADPTASADTAPLGAALQRLPAKQAAAIVLRYHHGYSNREIAYALSVSESTVASRIAAAKQQLAMVLRVEDPDLGPRSRSKALRIEDRNAPAASAPAAIPAHHRSSRELQ
jgi:RNA polymerase sigma-70 factor (ECF subfamily)